MISSLFGDVLARISFSPSVFSEFSSRVRNDRRSLLLATTFSGGGGGVGQGGGPTGLGLEILHTF